MSELLLQTIVERLEGQDLLLQTMSTDADKSQLEIRTKLAELRTDISSPQSSRSNTDTKEIAKLTAAVEALQAAIPVSVPVKPRRYLLLTKATWFVVGMFTLFLAMSWCWGYTFRAWSASEMEGVKFRYLRSVTNSSVSRFCRKADSLYAAGSLDTLRFYFAGEKEK